MDAQRRRAIFRFYRTHRRMPSITEVMELFGLRSRNSAFVLVNKLIDQGVLEKDTAGKIIPSARAYELPLLNRIRAGFATPAEEDMADTISVGEYLIKDKDASFLLEVVGDSMKDAGIVEGDKVIFERTGNYKEGDIVIALTEDGYTLKFLRKKGGKYFLEAGNEKYPPIYPKEGEIIGVVTGTFRKYK